MFGVLDSVMKYVMNNDRPFGGKLVVANGDHVQLQPILGRPFWMSTHLMMSFDILLLKKYVRMANDPTLQNVLGLLRSPTMSEDQREEVLHAVEANCNFIDTWDNVAPELMRVLTTKKAQEQINAKYLETMQNDPNVRHVVSYARDEILENDRWTICSGYRKKTLTRNALEPEELVIIEGGVYAFTYNKTEGNATISQGGLTIVENIPQQFNDQSKLCVVLVPPGERNIFPARQQWKRIQIGRQASVPILVGPGLFAKRTQFPLRYYTVQNFHRVMGCTAQAGIATQLSVNMKPFRMWDLGQLVVLLSRVSRMDMISFIGDKEDNLHAIEQIMTKPGKFTEAIEERLLDLNVLPRIPPQRVVFSGSHPFTPVSSEIPNVSGGYVYLLVCVHQPYLSAPRELINILGDTASSMSNGNGVYPHSSTTGPASTAVSCNTIKDGSTAAAGGKTASFLDSVKRAFAGREGKSSRSALMPSCNYEDIYAALPPDPSVQHVIPSSHSLPRLQPRVAVGISANPTPMEPAQETRRQIISRQSPEVVVIHSGSRGHTVSVRSGGGVTRSVSSVRHTSPPYRLASRRNPPCPEETNNNAKTSHLQNGRLSSPEFDAASVNSLNSESSSLNGMVFGRTTTRHDDSDTGEGVFLLLPVVKPLLLGEDITPFIQPNSWPPPKPSPRSQPSRQEGLVSFPPPPVVIWINPESKFIRFSKILLPKGDQKVEGALKVGHPRNPVLGASPVDNKAYSRDLPRLLSSGSIRNRS
ncbi:unnamed protein product [Cyprideis torosa]|uniref:Uncharacterized protein n=1 Tax=Cyprideis torosa TaxID=163714 RepID=A0A7R8WEZ8_9CRUS|nr:unnamed protein product [Cyprideis torosa]CAG0893520.1 unnamed protein product [Cyprideis torosa]